MILVRYCDGYPPDYTPFREEWPVVKETRCTWTVERFGEKHIVLKIAHKKWACETTAAAWESYIARKRRQINILTGNLNRAKCCLAVAQRESMPKQIPLLTYEDGSP